MVGMNVMQCSMCNKLFQSYSGRICPDCIQKVDEGFVKIREHLFVNPNSGGVDEIAEATQVSRKIVLHLLREKRLVARDSSGSSLLCEVCHTPISSGKYCENCQMALAKKLGGALPPAPAVEKKPEKTGPKMHINRG